MKTYKDIPGVGDAEPTGTTPEDGWKVTRPDGTIKQVSDTIFLGMIHKDVRLEDYEVPANGAH